MINNYNQKLLCVHINGMNRNALSPCMRERNTSFVLQNHPNANFHSESKNMTDSLIYSIILNRTKTSRVPTRNPSDTKQTAVLLPNSVLLNLLVDGIAWASRQYNAPSIATIQSINISTATMCTYILWQ